MNGNGANADRELSALAFIFSSVAHIHICQWRDNGVLRKEKQSLSCFPSAGAFFRPGKGGFYEKDDFNIIVDNAFSFVHADSAGSRPGSSGSD